MEQFIQNIKFPNNISCVKIDVGLSYNAPQSQVWLEHDPNLFVFGFEPNPECVQTLYNGNIQKKHPAHGTPIKQDYLDNRFCLLPVALGNVKEPIKMPFYQMQNDCGTSSLYEPIDSTIGPVKNIMHVQVFSLKHFFDVFCWDKFKYIEYLKIDAQGSDYDILVGAGDYLKERVVYITAEPECSQYANSNHNNTQNIQNYLESQGFERVSHPNTTDPTFLNRKFSHLKDSIFIWQRG
jgi:hypothetical protein